MSGVMSTKGYMVVSGTELSWFTCVRRALPSHNLTPYIAVSVPLEALL